jgi:glycine reductase
VSEALEIPAVTAMHPDNPGVDAYRGEVVTVRAAENVAGMAEAIEGLVAVGRKLARGEKVDPDHDPVLPAGRRRNVFADATGAERAVEMLLAKLGGRPFETEYPMPVFDRVPPAPPLADPATATIALVTSGGIVPAGNPDRIRAANAEGWGRYDISDLDALSAEEYETVHGGYDPTHANADPNRVMPLDMARALERDGRIGRLHDHYYATVGNATEVARARRFGREIAEQLIADGVQAVILTST